MRTIHLTILLTVALLSTGCAFQKQTIQLEPNIEVPTGNTGGGKSTMISVMDERPRSTLGTLGVGGVGEQITLEGDLADSIKDAVTKGLELQGFLANGSLENQLRIEIRSLDYAVNSGFWSGRLNVDFLLKGICMKNDSRPYEQMYRGEVRRNVQVVQSESNNNQYVNEAVSQSVNGLLNDETMIHCLAQ